LKAANAQESDASTPEEVRVAKEAALLAEMNIAAQSKNLDHAVSEKLRYKQLFDRADKELAALKSAVEELQKDLAEAEKLGVKVQDVGAIPPAPDEIHPAASAAQ